MSDWQLNTPVAFIIFNRPDTTKRVFAEIAKAKPPKLLIVADGPRLDRPGEMEKCVATRAIIDGVDWDCEVLTNYSEINLGCKNRVASGLDWVFEQVPEAIILEDDCLPDPTFFRFCEELLGHYRDDERISMISGTNLQFGQIRGNSSYYFSRYHLIWGWASWRRAWKHYDRDAEIWPEIRDNSWLNVMVKDKTERKNWMNMFEEVYKRKVDTWDYQWTLAAWSQGMVAIIPSLNLISNIGFGLEATHTTGESIYSELPTRALSFPMAHPKVVLPDAQADSFTACNTFSGTLAQRVVRKLSGLIKGRFFFD